MTARMSVGKKLYLLPAAQTLLPLLVVAVRFLYLEHIALRIANAPDLLWNLQHGFAADLNRQCRVCAERLQKHSVQVKKLLL